MRRSDVADEDPVDPDPELPDLLDPHAGGSPFADYELLRGTGPVVHDTDNDIWVVSRYEDCLTVLKDHETFRQWDTSEMRGGASSPDGAAGAPAHGHGTGDVDRVPTLANTDPPEHTRYRALLSEAWSPKRAAEQMRPRIRALAGELLDGVVARGSAELVSDFAEPLPVIVIAEILGVPPNMRDTFKRWSDDLIAPLAGPLSDERRRECARSMREFRAYFLDQLEERRRQPRNDVISALLEVRTEQHDPLSDAEIISLLVQLLVAGHETTTNLISSAALVIASTPKLQARMRNDAGAIRSAIEEILRLQSPVQALFRHTSQTTEISGVEIPRGAKVLVVFGSANRDDPPFSDPASFDESRDNVRRHLAFGYGIHYCVGAPLARVEGQIALEQLLDRLPNLRLAEGYEAHHHPHPLLRGLRSLEVTFDPVKG